MSSSQQITTRESVVLCGGSPVLVGREVPFAPFAAALTNLREQLGAGALIEQLGPETQLSRLLPDHREGRADPSPQFGPLQLFEQFIALLASLGGQRDGAAVLVLEDLHWSDASTLELLAFIVLNLTSGNVFVIATFRAAGSGSPDLQRLLLEAVRQVSVTHLELNPLGVKDILALARSVSSGSRDSDALESIAATSGGNPLFAEYLLATPDSRGLASLPG